MFIMFIWPLLLFASFAAHAKTDFQPQHSNYKGKLTIITGKCPHINTHVYTYAYD